MPKLNSEEIKKVVAEQAEIFNDEWHCYESECEEEELGVSKLWKRFSKKLVSTCINDGQDISEFTPDYQFFQDYGAYFNGWENETVLGDVKLANTNCITRHFIHKYANSSLDCCVLTDEKDEQIIALLWHSD